MSECIDRIRRVLENFETARADPRSMTVTQLARRLASPKSHGGSWEQGFKAHNVWGDPYGICTHYEYSTPLPLAYMFKRTWIYGIADLVRFIKRVPVEVIELKYYEEVDRYSVIQVKMYAWLTAKCFNARPRAYLVLGWDGRRYSRSFEVRYSIGEVEELIGRALSKSQLSS